MFVSEVYSQRVRRKTLSYCVLATHYTLSICIAMSDRAAVSMRSICSRVGAPTRSLATRNVVIDSRIIYVNQLHL